MDLIDRLKQLAARLPATLEHLQTEEATKTALVLPFISALGYDVFNPAEVVPEYTPDVGIKRGEKVDYAIIADGEPCILFECKRSQSNLDEDHANAKASTKSPFRPITPAIVREICATSIVWVRRLRK